MQNEGSFQTTKTFKKYKRLKVLFRQLHGRSVNSFVLELNNQLEKDAEIDKERFWRTVKSRKCKPSLVTGAGIKFSLKKNRSRGDLTAQWCEYFKNFYSISESPAFDSQWYNYVTKCVSNTFQRLKADKDAYVSPNIVKKAIETLPKEKAGSCDNIVYTLNLLYHQCWQICKLTCYGTGMCQMN